MIEHILKSNTKGVKAPLLCTQQITERENTMKKYKITFKPDEGGLLFGILNEYNTMKDIEALKKSYEDAFNFKVEIISVELIEDKGEEA